jgi:hypothetical protein
MFIHEYTIENSIKYVLDAVLARRKSRSVFPGEEVTLAKHKIQYTRCTLRGKPVPPKPISAFEPENTEYKTEQ